MKLSKNSYIRYLDADRYTVGYVPGWSIYSRTTKYTGSPTTYITADHESGTRSTVTHNSDSAYRTFFVTNSASHLATTVSDVYTNPIYQDTCVVSIYDPIGTSVNTVFYRDFYNVNGICTSVAMAWISSDLKQEGWEEDDIAKLSYVWRTRGGTTEIDGVSVTLGDDAPLRYVSHDLCGGANVARRREELHNSLYYFTTSKNLPRFALSCVRHATYYPGGYRCVFRLPEEVHTVGNVKLTAVSHITAVEFAQGMYVTAARSSYYTLQTASSPVTITLTVMSHKFTDTYRLPAQKLPERYTILSSGAVVSGLRHMPRGLHWVTSGVTSFPVDAYSTGSSYARVTGLFSGSAHYVVLDIDHTVSCSEYSAGVYAVSGGSLVAAPDVFVNVADFAVVNDPPLLRHNGHISGFVLADEATVELSDNLQIQLANSTNGALFGHYADAGDVLINIPASSGTCSQYLAPIYPATDRIVVVAGFQQPQATQEPPKITVSTLYSSVGDDFEFTSRVSSLRDTRWNAYDSAWASSHRRVTRVYEGFLEIVPSAEGSANMEILQNTFYLDQLTTYTSAHNAIDNSYGSAYHSTYSAYTSAYDIGSPAEPYTHYRYEGCQPALCYYSARCGGSASNDLRLPCRFSVNPTSVWMGSDPALDVDAELYTENAEIYGSYELGGNYEYTNKTIYSQYNSGSSYVGPGGIDHVYIGAHYSIRIPNLLISCMLPRTNGIYTIVSSHLRMETLHSVNYHKEARGFAYNNHNIFPEFGNGLSYNISIGRKYRAATKIHYSFRGSEAFAAYTEIAVRIISDSSSSELVPYTCLIESYTYTGEHSGLDVHPTSLVYTTSMFRAFTYPSIATWVSEFKMSAEQFVLYSLPETRITYYEGSSNSTFSTAYYYYDHHYGASFWSEEICQPEMWDTYTCLLTVASF